MGRTLYPKDFGAVGDGVHNDRPAWKRMMAEVQPGDVIDLSRGSYYLGPPWQGASDIFTMKAPLSAVPDWYSKAPGRQTVFHYQPSRSTRQEAV